MKKKNDLGILKVGGIMASGGMGKTTLFSNQANLCFRKPYKNESGYENRIAIVKGDVIYWPADYELEGLKLADCINPGTLAFLVGEQLSLSYECWNEPWGLISTTGDTNTMSLAEVTEFLNSKLHVYISHSFFPQVGAGIIAPVSSEFHLTRLNQIHSPHWLTDPEKENTRAAVLAYHEVLRRKILDESFPGIIIEEEDVFLEHLLESGELGLLANSLVFHEQPLSLSHWVM